MHSEQKAIGIASLGAGILALLKFSIGILGGSMVLIASALDSILDLIVSLFNLLAIKESRKPADKEHNYGHGKLEGLAALFEGALIFCSGLFIIASSAKKILYGEQIEQLGYSIIIMIISLTITGIIVYFLYKAKQRTKSLIIKADLMHYKMDLLTNIGIILSLLIIQRTGYLIIDQLIAIAIAIYILFGCKNILRNGFDLLMDKSIGKDKEISEIILSHPEIKSFHKLKSHQSGGKVFISVHVVFKNSEISLKKAHLISYEIEDQLEKYFKKASIIIRLDPFDDNRKAYK